MSSYLLLLHQLSVGAVVDDVATKDGGSQDSINFFGVDVLELAVENKVVSSGANGDGGPLAKQNKGENIAKLQAKRLDGIFQAQHSKETEKGAELAAYLGAVLLEERGRVHSISHGAADKGEPVENQRRLIGVLEKNLAGNIESNGNGDEPANGDGNLGPETQSLELLRERVARSLLKDTHTGGDADGACAFSIRVGIKGQ